MDSPEQSILLIERSGNKEVTFASALDRKGYEVHVVETGRHALNHVEIYRPAIVILNASSLGTSGTRICRRLVDNLNGISVIHIMPPNSDDADLKSSPADVVLAMPFTSRKLINRIDRLMPIPHKDLMTLGDIQFAPDARIVKAHGREKRLTPKAANLLLIFMKHPEKILGRGLLMQEVWHTDYIGDTRTLDVHIRWLREALEPKPSRPQHIETVRGRGYCFFPSLEDKRERKKSQK